ncbi:hypothetical protein BGW38_007271 [Lunasporangiospora selenospora]|uniref:P-loop containing nucleoside triphosphate hydrolase protein n=1 Tax=Lunasporangiospora selenospora TaxID=979761 RepID=A0A9P6FZA8_9FUNG|nr:hypothetical protein BGW38_007271 [Lunasporangiospora selenospora]
MEWLVSKTGSFLNSTAAVFDHVIQVSTGLEATLSPAAIRVVKTIMGNDVLSAGFFLMILGSFYTFFRDLIVQYYYEVVSWFYVSVEVEEGDDCYRWLSDWVAERPLTTSVRHLTVKATWDDEREEGGYYQSTRGDERPRLVFIPGKGRHILYHKGYKINVSRERPEQAASADSEQSRLLASIQKKQCLTISTFGWDISRLKTIVLDAMEESYKKKQGKTTIYTTQPYDSYWSNSSTRVPRAFHSVILSDGLKAELLEDIMTFRGSSQWYHDRGVPYRRGYLLHGPPGTGKTSFIIALAGHLDMSVCIVNLGISGLNDQQLDQLLNNAPRNSILLMEDVDAALVKRKAGKAQGGTNNVTLSGILNALDGITAQEGSVVFMTTNHIRKLAPALIRPGRCDRKLLFDYADEHQIRGMFLKFFLSRSAETGLAVNEPVDPRSYTRKTDNKTTSTSPSEAAAQKEALLKTQGRKEEFDAMIHRLADEITTKLSYKDTITTAQLQGFFMLHRDNPDTILDKIPEFLEELRREREALSKKKSQRKERMAKKKSKEEAKEKKAKEDKERRRAAGEEVESSADEEEEEDDENDSDSFSDSDYYDEVTSISQTLKGLDKDMKEEKKEVKEEKANGFAHAEPGAAPAV